MNEIQLTDHLVAHIGAEGTCGRYQAKICEECEKYAKRERKAIAYVATLKEES